MGDAGVGILGAAIGARRDRRRGVRGRDGHRRGGSRACSRPRSSPGARRSASSGSHPARRSRCSRSGSRASATRCSTSPGLTLLQRGISGPAAAPCSPCSRSWPASASRSGRCSAPALVTAIGVERALVITGIALPITAVLGWPWVRRLDDEGVLPERQARLLRGDPAVRAAAARRAGADRRRDGAVQLRAGRARS